LPDLAGMYRAFATEAHGKSRQYEQLACGRREFAAVVRDLGAPGRDASAVVVDKSFGFLGLLP
jgi:hypothetical protein